MTKYYRTLTAETLVSSMSRIAGEQLTLLEATHRFMRHLSPAGRAALLRGEAAECCFVCQRFFAGSELHQFVSVDPTLYTIGVCQSCLEGSLWT